MRAEPFALMLMAAGFAVGVAAKDAPEPPSMDMLEFLGSFETAGGRFIDPLQLEDVQKKRKVAVKGESGKKKPKKTPSQKGKNDE